MMYSSSSVQSYLVEQRLGRLATITHDGLPHIVAVAFVNNETNLYFSTFTETKKVRNIRNNRNVAFIVDDSGGSVGWRYVTVEGYGYIITEKRSSIGSGICSVRSILSIYRMNGRLRGNHIR